MSDVEVCSVPSVPGSGSPSVNSEHLWDAAKPIHIIHMGLMRDTAMSNQLLVAHLWQVMPYFSRSLRWYWKHGTLSANLSQNWCCWQSCYPMRCCQTISHHSHMGLMRDTAMSNQLLDAGSPSVTSHAIFQLESAENENITHYCQQIWDKTEAVGSHDTLWDAAKPFHIIHMGLMGDPAMCSQLLVAHLWQVMPYFSRSCRMWLKKKRNCVSKSELKMMLFAVMTPYEMLPNHVTSYFTSSIRVWWWTLQWATSCW
jgi:hypothetical protein